MEYFIYKNDKLNSKLSYIVPDIVCQTGIYDTKMTDHHGDR